jgi:hypothetical protein
MAGRSQIYAERQKRYFDAVALRKPDRVPFAPISDFLPAKLGGHTIKEVMYDHKAMGEDWLAYHERYQPDQGQNPFRLRGFGALLEAFDFQHLKWAGHGLPDDIGYQFVELELLKAEEYDHFIGDMTDFMIRRYFPRIFKNLEGLAKLPPFSGLFSYFWGLYWPAAFLDPDVQKAVEHVKLAAGEAAKVLAAGREFEVKLREAGFPPGAGAYTQAPFDTLSDVLRGTKGLMLDMRRRPDKIIQACEKLLPIMINAALGGAKASGCPICFIPLHKCMNTFMSQDQFERFYWPTFKAVLEELCQSGLTPWVMVEGNCDDRLKSFREVPAGKVVWHIEGSTITKVKEVFRGHSCIRGNLPVSVLVMGTPDDVRAECRKTFDLLKEDGGFMFDAGAGIGDAAMENIEAMFNYVRDNGAY